MSFDRGDWAGFVDETTMEVHGTLVPFWGPLCRFGHGPMRYYAHTGLRVYYWCEEAHCGEEEIFWTWEIEAERTDS